HFVEIAVVRLKSGDAAAALQQGVDGAEGVLDDLLHAHEAAADAFFRELEDLRFNIVEYVFGRIALLRCASNGRGGCVDQAAKQRLVSDNLDVVLNARPVRYAIEKAGNVGHAADRLEFRVTAEFLGQRDQVDGMGSLSQIDHSRVNPTVRIEQEIFRLQVLRSLAVGKVVEQDRAQDRAFCFHVDRKRLRGDVVSCRHLVPSAGCAGVQKESRTQTR